MEEEVYQNESNYSMFSNESVVEEDTFMQRLSRRASHTLRTTSLMVHSTIGLTLNIMALLASHPFELLPRYCFIALFLLSLLTTYRYFYNMRCYDIYDFEQLY